METIKPKKLSGTKDTIFKLKDKKSNTSYTLSFSIESSSLTINISEDESLPPINYLQKFTLKDLESQSRYFKLFESLEEFIPEIKNLNEQNKITFRKEKSSIILIFMHSST